jgi:hypothetical protein
VWLARGGVRLDDSEDFKDALRLAQPFIALGGRSPRSIKRFINHVRYIAMRMRHEPEMVPWWRGSRFLASAPDTPSGEREGDIPDPVLVMLAAIFRCNTRWLDEKTLDEPRLRGLIEQDFATSVPDFQARDMLAQELGGAISQFNGRFQETQLFRNAARDREYIERFYEVMAEELPNRLRP